MRSLFLHPNKTITLALGLEPGATPDSAKPIIRDKAEPGDIVFTFDAVKGAEKLEYFPDILAQTHRPDRTRVYPFLKLKTKSFAGLPPYIEEELKDKKTGELKIEAVLDALDSRAAVDLAVALADRSQIDEVQLGKSDSPEASSSADSGNTRATV